MMRYVAILGLLAGTWGFAAEPQRFEHTNDRFAITLTADWKEVEASSAPYAKDVLSDDGSSTVARAYQRISDTNFAAVVFVELDETWRIPERELALLQIDNLRTRFLTERLEGEGLRLLDSYFSTNRRVLRVSAACDIGGAKMRQLIGWYFTDTGSYSVSCVAPVEHFKAVAADFNKALDTFYFDPELAYRPRPGAGEQTAAGSGTRVVKVRFGWIFGLAAVAVFLLRRLFTRVNSDEV